MPSWTIRDSFDSLVRDKVRDELPFSEDLKLANEVLLHPFSTDGDCRDAMNLWFAKNQPCLFGRIAATADRIHYCFLRDSNLRSSDDAVADVIRSELRAWKQRSLRPNPQLGTPAHGFVLQVLSPRVLWAQPNASLQQFAEAILSAWGCPESRENHGTVHWETLYLERPTDQTISRFTFSVDFFASAGDNRWWHDHRIPGGCGFTANSAGHMGRYREWYEHAGEQRLWLLKRAMETIALPPDSTVPRATWLLELVDGRPFVTSVKCPFSAESDVPQRLRNKDWTRYAGHLHTDLAVRPEFFEESPGMSKDVANRKWLQDFGYLYDPGSKDHVRFVAGQLVSAEEVIDEIGAPSEFTSITGRAKGLSPHSLGKAAKASQRPTTHPEVAALLQKCRDNWETGSEENHAMP